MTTQAAARAYVAALIERQLASAHVEGEFVEHPRTCFAGGSWRNRKLVLDTFEHAPPHVAAALGKMTEAEREEVGEEMARIAEVLRHPPTSPLEDRVVAAFRAVRDYQYPDGYPPAWIDAEEAVRRALTQK